jgi:hypothetical protein
MNSLDRMGIHQTIRCKKNPLTPRKIRELLAEELKLMIEKFK